MESLECLTAECISLLHKNNLLKPLIKNELVGTLLSTVEIEKELKDTAIKKFITENLGLKDRESFQSWLTSNNYTHKDVEDLALVGIRSKRYCKSKFEHQSESQFLKRKSELDIVVYSLIRVKDSNKARELYIRVAEGEADFGDLATMYSEGIESKTRGIIGPVPIGTAHPSLKAHLKSSRPGEVQPPFIVEDSHVVIRVESLDPAKLDDFMREKMAEELFNNWVEAKVNEIRNNLVNSKDLNKNAGSTL